MNYIWNYFYLMAVVQVNEAKLIYSISFNYNMPYNDLLWLFKLLMYCWYSILLVADAQHSIQKNSF